MEALLSAAELQMIEQALQASGRTFDDIAWSGSTWSIQTGIGGNSSSGPSAAQVSSASIVGAAHRALPSPSAGGVAHGASSREIFEGQYLTDAVTQIRCVCAAYTQGEH
jgi:hypothetical protein